MTVIKQYIKDICESKLPQEKQIPDIRSKLYKQLFETYRKLHQNSPEITVNEAAKQYERALQDQIQRVDQLYAVPMYRSEREEYLQLYSIWSFCNLIYFTPFDNVQQSSAALMQWYNKTHKHDFYEYNTTSIFSHSDPMNHPDFWPYLIRMATLGELQIIANTLHRALRHHTNNDTLHNHLRALREMLRDNNNNKTITPRTKLDRPRLLQWRQQTTHPSFTTLLTILTGTDESIISHHATTPLHAFICCLYYNPDRHDRTTTSSTLHDQAQSFYQHHSTSTTTLYDLILVGKLTEAIEQSVRYDWCFLAHMVDLWCMTNTLSNAQELTVHVQENVQVVVPVSYHFVLFYASFIKNRFTDLWLVAFEYMMTCDTWGKEALIQHLREMDLGVQDAMVQEIVKFCKKHGLKDIGMELVRKKAVSCFQSKDYKTALVYYGQTEDEQDKTEDVFYAMIEDYCKTQQWIDPSSLERHQGTNYDVYRYLWLMQLDELNDEVVTLFKQLIHNERVSLSFMPLILWQGLQLLQGKMIQQ
ncbi:MAG: nucleoporin Nup85-like protein [Benjaminiella poitrasii]|nr:MAG: nucleoporin Nup85-like protein [Benjaminiella poitrasii]